MTSFFALFSDYARMRRSHYARETVTILWCTENSSPELERETLILRFCCCVIGAERSLVRSTTCYTTASVILKLETFVV